MNPYDDQVMHEDYDPQDIYSVARNDQDPEEVGQNENEKNLIDSYDSSHERNIEKKIERDLIDVIDEENNRIYNQKLKEVEERRRMRNFNV
ncbi:hypothetical protein ABK040_004511 [Willaertia magna]